MKRILISLCALVLGACVDEMATRDDPATVTAPYTVTVEGEGCVALVAGQHIDVGTVCTTVVGDALRFTYHTTNGWLLHEAHLWVGLTAPTDNIPPGQCPYVDDTMTPVDTFSFDVPLAVFGFDPTLECVPTTAYAMAHAAVLHYTNGCLDGEETAYGQGPAMPGDNWAMYFTVSLTCEVEPPPPEPVCETFFAYASPSTCLIDLPGLTAARWGWSLGPVVTGHYELELFAGAAHCDTARGTLVGTAAMAFGRTGIALELTAAEGVTFDETHVWVGETPLPLDRRGNYIVSPGRFPWAHDLDAATSDHYVIPARAPAYVVVHGVACW